MNESRILLLNMEKHEFDCNDVGKGRRKLEKGDKDSEW